MSEFKTFWHGERGHYLSVDGAPYRSMAARVAAEGDSLTYEKPKSSRGYRAPGFRLRDTVLKHLPAATSAEPITRAKSLREVCKAMHSTGERDMAAISRALTDLVREGKVDRAKPGPEFGPRLRWLYWRLP